MQNRNEIRLEAKSFAVKDLIIEFITALRKLENIEF